MRHTLFFIAFFLAAVAAQGRVRFESGRTYHLSCLLQPGGDIVPGALHDRLIPIYYAPKGGDETYRGWIVDRQSDGSITLRNAATGEYLTYDGVRTNVQRGVCLTDSLCGDSSRWVVAEVADRACYLIHNKHLPEQRLSVRNGSYIVGSYTQTGEASDNECFRFSDEGGEAVFGIDTGPMALGYLVSDLRFNGKSAVYDSLYHTYMLPLPAHCRTENAYQATVSYRSAEAGARLCVGDDEAADGETLTFEDMAGGKSFRLALRNDTGTVAAADITFTFLPIIELTGNNFSNSTYRTGTIRVHQPDLVGEDSVYHMKARYRGAFAATLRKKAYAVKLTDATGNNKIDRSFLGMRSDNSWILDAMAIDPGRMRNRVSTDLWNDYATRPYYHEQEPNMMHGTRGKFVEVLLNGHYAGLYCFTEKIDRKQLKLVKSDTVPDAGRDNVRGCLYKSVQWGYATFMGYDQSSNTFPKRALSGYSNSSVTWSNWELKYPNRDDGEAIDWEPLYRAIQVPATYSDEAFLVDVDRYFDLPVVKDYYLLIELMMGFDNNGKNMYWYTYDKSRYEKLSLAPWDMDGTWGRNWDGSQMDRMAEVDFTYYMNYERKSRHALFKRLISLDYEGWNRQLASRYAELRDTHFKADKLVERFRHYKELFEDSGAMEREMARWDGSDGIYIDMDAEMDYLESWIRRRLETMDRTYSYVSAIETAEQAAGVNVFGGKGELFIHTAVPQEAVIYTAAGQPLRTVSLQAGSNRIGGLTKGIYIVKGRKAAVR